MDYVLNLLPPMFGGLGATLRLFVLVLIVSVPLGWLISLLLVSRWAPFRFAAKAYTWVLRGTPLILQLAFVYYGLPFIGGGVTLGKFAAALLAFSLNYAAYFGEIFRGGIQSMEKGQLEAAEVLGMTRAQTMFRIILPQAFKRVLPSVGNEVITLIKDTALVHAIAMVDLLRVAQVAVTRDFDSTAFVVAAVFYLVLTFVAVQLQAALEKRFAYYS